MRFVLGASARILEMLRATAFPEGFIRHLLIALPGQRSP
jgi:hypothetical protein